jgi:hypothetical protein
MRGIAIAIAAMRRVGSLIDVLTLLACATQHLAAAADDRPVALPPFIVEETAKGPPWRYVEAVGYEILSRCSDPVTRRVVETHYQLHQLLAEILPAELQVKMSVPRSLILYDEALQPAASQEVIARLLRTTPAPPIDDMPIFGGRRGLPTVTPRRYSFLPNLRLWDRDAMALFMIVRSEDFDPERISLTHDYVTFLVRSRIPALPPWFMQGFLSLHQQITYGGKRLTLPPLEWISAQLTDAIKKDPKAAPPLLPLTDFFGAKLPAPEPNVPIDPIKRWQAQALLFVRWGLDPAGGQRRAAFWKFTERCAIAGASEDLFQECFGLDYEHAQTQLAAYLPIALRRSLEFRPARMARLPNLPLHDASPGQIARLKGDWERLEITYVKANFPELASKYLEQARRTLKRGYDRDERDPRLLAALGLCECDAGNDPGAREYFEAATQIGPIRPRANFELARLRCAEFRAQPAGNGGQISTSQTAAILQPLFAARAQEPPLPEVYELIAEAWASADATPTRGHLAVLSEGVRLFPRRTELILRTAELYLRNGFQTDAAAFIDLGARVADDPHDRERVAALQQQLTSR